MASPRKYEPEPAGLHPAGPPPAWARHHRTWQIVLAQIDGAWRWAVLRGWFTHDSGSTWCAALEFARLDTDLPPGSGAPSWPGRRPAPGNDGIVRAWYVFTPGCLLPAPAVPPDWTAPHPQP